VLIAAGADLTRLTEWIACGAGASREGPLRRGAHLCGVRVRTGEQQKAPPQLPAVTSSSSQGREHETVGYGMMGSFDDRVVVVTGGATGIGLASARQFAAEGATVVMAGRDVTRGKARQR
jgi:short chain dehydrogenase